MIDYKSNKEVDFFGESTEKLLEKKLFLFDMDGTIYEEDNIFEGTHELMEFIEKIGGKYVFITNNSSKSVERYVDKLNFLGIKCNKENFFTSSQATALFISEKYSGKKIYCQGTKSLIQELQKAGLNIVTNVEDDIEVVLVGFDTELTSQKIRNTCELLTKLHDIPYIATNPDLRCPVSFGYIPDCGSICNMIKSVTGREPFYIGKPEATMVNIVREKHGYSKVETVVIGDRLYTDIATAINAEVTSICVLTGEASVADIIDGSIKPTYTFRSVKEIYQAISRR